jgi:hypothetical protein
MCVPCARRALTAQESVREAEDRALAAELAKAAQAQPAPPAVTLESIPLETHVRVGFDIDGNLSVLHLTLLGSGSVVTVYPEGAEDEGDLFQRALDRARAVALCVRRVPVEKST